MLGNRRRLAQLSRSIWFDNLTGISAMSKRELPKGASTRAIHFASILELETYKKIRKVLPDECIDRQFNIPLLPSKDIYKAISWNIDFRLNINNKYLYLETKGKWLLTDSEAKTRFTDLIRLVAEYKPDILESLFFASDSIWKMPGTNQNTIKIGHLPELLKKYKNAANF